jgi:hypothetical protein
VIRKRNRNYYESKIQEKTRRERKEKRGDDEKKWMKEDGGDSKWKGVNNARGGVI